MTASASPSVAPSQTASGNTAARTSSGSTTSARHGHGSRHAIDLFSNLLGLMGAAGETPNLLGASAADPADAPSNKAALDALGNPLTNGSANPLADLIGWTGGPFTPVAGDVALGDGKTARGGRPLGTTADPGLATATADGGPPGALQGMTLLAQPVDADAGLLAQLKTGAAHRGGGLADIASMGTASPDSANVTIGLTAEAQAAQPTSTVRSNTLTASRPANWRSTATLGPANPAPNAAASMPTSTAAIQVAQNFTAPTGRDFGAALPIPRNSSAQGERFSASLTAEAGPSGMALAGGAQARSSHGEQPSSGHGEAALGAIQMADTSGMGAPETAFSLDNALSSDGSNDPNDPNASLGMHQLRHASVRIGDGTEEAIDIRLALAGDTVNVNFRTDNDEVRAGLQHHAGESLADMMQRSGLQLSSLSIDAPSPQTAGQSGQPGHPGQGGGQSPAQASPSQGIAGAARDRSPARAAPERVAITRRADGGPALDVFA